MKCYYEELNVARDATENDIKTAYRKLALKWHPDKNLNSLEEAKERFQLIQQAYEVLSDPQERAWYDNHREQILRGRNSVYEDKCLDVFQYFTGSCFKGYGDDEKGFYSVYREVFNKLVAEDMEFIDEEDKIENIPNFGYSNSNYEEVVGPFYAYWSAYSTKKTYEWLCPYDIRELKERRILRAVEKEMKKIVSSARKERNEEVRNLVAFVRKRDKRVQAHRIYLEEKAEHNRIKQEQNRIEKIRKRQKELEEVRKNATILQSDDYEEQLKNLELEYGSDEDSVDEEYDEESEEDSDNANKYEDYIDDLYCVACNKSFKNENAFANHESSKKHKENVEKLKTEMQNEEDEFNTSLQTDNEQDCTLDHNTTEDDNDVDVTPSSSKKKSKKKNKKIKLPKTNETSDEEILKSNEENNGENLCLGKEGLNTKHDTDEDNDWDKTALRKGSKKQKTKKNQIKKHTEICQKETKEEKSEPLTNGGPDHHPKNDTNDKPNHICVTCKANFSSKNKLFAHLKSMNHGVYIPKVKSPLETAKSKKGNSKRR